MAFAWRLRGAVDTAALERALAELVRRHETLRTHIERASGEPAQVVEPFGGWTLPVVGSPTPEPDRAAVFGQRATDEANLPFDLAAGPLFRAALLRAAADDHLLTWTMHHAVSDGWSTGVFIRELTALYDAFAAGRPPPLAPLPLQYGDVAVRQRERLSGDALAREVAWWKERLAGAPALLELPTDRPRPAVRTDRGGTFAFELDGGVARRVDALARAGDATPFMVLLAAWQALLARWSGADDVVVGTPIANRTSPDVEGLIGYFANTLVLRGDLRGEPTFRELLARVREATLGAYEHQDLPFEKLVEELNPERSLSHTPLFQVAFVLQNLAGAGPAAAGPQRLGAATVEPVGRTRDSARFDLLLTIAQEAGRTSGSIEYAADLWDAETVRRMLGHFATLLDGALARPDARIGDLPLMDAGESDELRRLAAGPAAARDHPPRSPVSSPRRWRARPGRPPSTFGDGVLTYAELDAPRQRARPPPTPAASAPRRRWPCAWSARWRWWWRVRHPQGRRRVCPARPRVSRRTASPHAGGFGRAGSSSPSAGSPGGSRGRGPIVVLATPTWDAKDDAPDRARRPGHRSGFARLRHLHLRFHRPAQGRGRYASRRGAPLPCDERVVRLRCARRRGRCSTRTLRLLRLGVLGRAAARWPPGWSSPSASPRGRAVPTSCCAARGDGLASAVPFAS